MAHEFFSEHHEIIDVQQDIMQALRRHDIVGLEVRTLSDTSKPWSERISICSDSATSPHAIITALEQFLATHGLTAYIHTNEATQDTTIRFSESQ